MEFGLDNILGEQDIETLFADTEDEKKPDSDQEEVETEESPKDSKDNENSETTEAVDPEDLFEAEEKQPESVGSDSKEDIKGEEGTTPEEGGGTSPNNFYSSIATALAEDGIFPNLEDETIKKADSAESFSDLIESEINARFDEKQQRILKALDNNVEPSDIRKFENTLNYIASITEGNLTEESEKGEQLRRNIIYQDFINKGYSQEKAQKFTERTIDAGTDVEDAKEALQSNKEFFQSKYDELLEEAEEKAEQQRVEQKKQADALKNSIMKDKQLFGDIELDDSTRKRVFDNISKPIYKDPDTGEYFTALQKYEMEHRADFLKYAGLIYTLTNGFKDFESFTKGKVKKEVKKGLRELEQTLNNTSRNTNGSLKMVTRRTEDPESYIGKGIKLDL